MPDAEVLRQKVRDYQERFTAGDIDGVVDLYTADATVEDPVGTPRHEGADAIRAFYAGTREMSPDIELRATGPTLVAGNEVAFPMQAVTTMGEMKLAVDIIDVMRFDDDAKVVEMRAYWSMADMKPLEAT